MILPTTVVFLFILSRWSHLTGRVALNEVPSGSSGQLCKMLVPTNCKGIKVLRWKATVPTNVIQSVVMPN